MQPEKKQIPVLIALCLILVLAVGYSVKKSLSSGAPVAAPATGTAATTQQTQESTGASAAQEAPPFTDYGFVGNPPRDPFEPQLLGAVAEGKPAATQPPNTNVRPFGKPGGVQMAKLQVAPAPLPGLPGSLRVVGPDGQPQAQQVEKPPFIATGVVHGKGDIAILRGEGGGRYFVQKGQSVGDGYVVSSVYPTGVVLKSKSRRIFLKLGGAQDARSNDQPR